LRGGGVLFRFNFDFESKVDDLGVNVHLDKLEFRQGLEKRSA
jgi:hypothetical protein